MIVESSAFLYFFKQNENEMVINPIFKKNICTCMYLNRHLSIFTFTLQYPDSSSDLDCSDQAGNAGLAVLVEDGMLGVSLEINFATVKLLMVL